MSDKFGWSVGIVQSAIPYISRIKLSDFYLLPEMCAEAYKVGRGKMKEIFGEEVPYPSVSCPALSYGHIACLGVKVLFPEDSDPGVRPIYGSVKEGIKALKKEIDFSKNELFQHYFNTFEYLKKEFPEEKISFSGFGYEGPVTSAVLLRGQDFYIDLYDYPQEVKEFLRLLTDSIVEFNKFINRLNKQPEVNHTSGGFCDDFASIISPSLLDEFVIPYWEQYYRGITTGERTIHVENLSPEHLKFLEKVNITSYDPSVSKKLNPKIIKENINIPFSWRLCSFQYPPMSKEDVGNWVMQSFKDGAPSIYTGIEKIMCENNNPEKVKTFIRTAKEITKF